MDGRGGGGSCVMHGYAPLGPSFSVSPLVKLLVADCGGAGKGGSCVLIPDLVIMAKVGASGGLLLLNAERIWEYCSRNSLRKGAEAELGELIELPAIDLRYVVVKAFPLREKWKNLNRDVSLVPPSACVYKELDDSLVRAATTASSLEAEQDSAYKQGRRIIYIDEDEDITLVNVQDDADNEMFDVDTVTGDEVFAEQEVAAKDVNLTVDEVTLSQALAALKSVKPKVKGDIIEESSIPVSADRASIKAKVQDKVKEKMIEPEKPLKKKDLIRLDEELASKLQAKFDEEERLAREKDKANVALTKEWDDIQAKIEADHELAQRLQAEEQEELSNMEGKKLKYLKNKSFDSIQKMFDRAFKRVNTFVDFRTDMVEGSSKRAGEELEQESTKKPLTPFTITDMLNKKLQ
ncbi:hypothetical protein Tco_0825337, partial [Tanacetum coccineum]